MLTIIVFCVVLLIVLALVLALDSLTIGEDITEEQYEELKMNNVNNLKIGNWVFYPDEEK